MRSVEPPDRDNTLTAEQGGAGTHALQDVLKSIEHALILTALKESHGNKAKAARALGITERLMGIRVKRLGIDWRGLRPRRKNPVGRSA